jgi:hypothetical protein
VAALSKACLCDPSLLRIAGAASPPEADSFPCSSRPRSSSGASIAKKFFLIFHTRCHAYICVRTDLHSIQIIIPMLLPPRIFLTTTSVTPFFTLIQCRRTRGSRDNLTLVRPVRLSNIFLTNRQTDKQTNKQTTNKQFKHLLPGVFSSMPLSLFDEFSVTDQSVLLTC